MIITATYYIFNKDQDVYWNGITCIYSYGSGVGAGAEFGSGPGSGSGSTV
jgi:hypothetical protein